jgi:hypothetical protein
VHQTIEIPTKGLTCQASTIKTKEEAATLPAKTTPETAETEEEQTQE